MFKYAAALMLALPLVACDNDDDKDTDTAADTMDTMDTMDDTDTVKDTPKDTAPKTTGDTSTGM